MMHQKRPPLLAGWFALLCMLFLAACDGRPSSEYIWELPVGVSPPPVPADNPMTVAKVRLGRYLFYERRLSFNERVACSSCHIQKYAFSDARRLPEGATGQHHPRNAMGLTNAAYAVTLSWANPVLQELERHVLVPMFAEFPIELGLTGREQEVFARLRQLPLYQKLFREAFPQAEELVTLRQVVFALASFQRTLLSFNAPYDRYKRGETGALTAQAKHGMGLFFSSRLQCFRCHSGQDLNQPADAQKKLLPTRPTFHNTGLYNIGGSGRYPLGGQGLYEFTSQDKDMGLFKAPTLRNVEVTAPYMHDGSIPTLSDVIEHYAAGGRQITTGPHAGDGRQHPNKSALLQGFTLSPAEKDALLAFLKGLTDRSMLTNPRLSDPFTNQP